MKKSATKWIAILLLMVLMHERMIKLAKPA